MIELFVYMLVIPFIVFIALVGLAIGMAAVVAVLALPAALIGHFSNKS